MFEQILGRFRAWSNRKRHADLIREYNREPDQEERFIIAQQMMIRDREAIRLRGDDRLPENYPEIWDYYIAPGRLGWEVARRRRAERQADQEKIRSAFAQMKRS